MIDFFLQGLRISAPYVLAALGGVVGERAGVIQLGLEGMLLGGAFAATVGAEHAGILGGLAAGALGGVAFAAIYAFVALRARADQVIAGVALNLLAVGLTRYLLKLIYHSASNSPRVVGFDTSAETGAFLGATAVAALALQVWMLRTPAGLRLRAIGEHPDAADSLGVDVLRLRAAAVLATGLLAGLGGAWLALDNHGFVDRMSGGRGYIALAAVIFGRWSPLGAAAACLLFGFADALSLGLQTAQTFPRELTQMLPYALTIIAVAGMVGRSRAPRALGVRWPP
ncbi:MAG TPA: ABC transporter permease [Haliangiales bacterium]|nr:ABC transporter permease [Haliangiales bacterium]